MKRTLRLFVLVGSFVVAVAAAATATAYASAPEIVRYTNSQVSTITCPDGVVLSDTFSESVTETTFFNASGTPVRLVVHDQLTGLITNSVSGNTYDDRSHVRLEVDLVTGEVKINGLFYNIVEPAHGTILLDVGTIRFGATGMPTFQSAKHPVLGAEDQSAVCDALI